PVRAMRAACSRGRLSGPGPRRAGTRERQGMGPEDRAGPSSERPVGSGPVIARQLKGDLLCIGCGYNLRGLSIREMCPECGIPVRATILGVIDPMADELAPIPRPRLVATG